MRGRRRVSRPRHGLEVGELVDREVLQGDFAVATADPAAAPGAADAGPGALLGEVLLVVEPGWEDELSRWYVKGDDQDHGGGHPQ